MLGSRNSLLASFAAFAMAISATAASAQTPTNPFRSVYGWGELPTGRKMGSTSAIHPTNDGMQMWVAERCGANTCVVQGGGTANVDPVLLYDLNGKLIRSFGNGKLAWPHGIFVDPQGNVWIADGDRGSTTVGNAVLKFSPMGELLMTIGTPGKAGVAGSLTAPNDVVVSPRTGNIFVAEGHTNGQGINDIQVFSPDGKYLRTIGKTGYGPVEFHEPHTLAFDSQGRLFVGDRYNNRIQIISEEGAMIAMWTQFGRPSGIFIDKNDVLYVADSESAPDRNNITGMRNAGWEKGIRIGDAKTGWVRYFIPDTKVDPSGFSGPEGVAVDANGAVYGAEVSQMRLAKHVMFHPPEISSLFGFPKRSSYSLTGR
jgi:sugar lactone lactonase YvrE